MRLVASLAALVLLAGCASDDSSSSSSLRMKPATPALADSAPVQGAGGAGQRAR